jgi:hypothetical protein
MARYDLDPDLRDRSRFLTALMGLAPSNDADDGAGIDEDALAELSDHAHGIMLATKLPPVTLLGAVDIEGLQTFNIGSLSSIVGHYVHRYALSIRHIYYPSMLFLLLRICFLFLSIRKFAFRLNKC